MDRSEGERRAAGRPGDQPHTGTRAKPSASGFAWERTSKGAERDLAGGRGEQSGLCEDVGSRASRSRRSVTTGDTKN